MALQTDIQQVRLTPLVTSGSPVFSYAIDPRDLTVFQGTAELLKVKDSKKNQVYVCKEYLTREECFESNEADVEKDGIDSLYDKQGVCLQAQEELELSQVLHHPNIVKAERVFSAKDEKGKLRTYLLLEFIDGSTLMSILAKDKQEDHRNKAVRLQEINQFLSAVEFALGKGYIHTALLQNMMIDSRDILKVVNVNYFYEVNEVPLNLHSFRSYIEEINCCVCLLCRFMNVGQSKSPANAFTTIKEKYKKNLDFSLKDRETRNQFILMLKEMQQEFGSWQIDDDKKENRSVN